ncbi:MAG TPA: FAD-dependent oxidoreductase [Planctomycetota bacterium]|nr:FAD-dependent oxidoreductase [Planctomycetota bacterium]
MADQRFGVVIIGAGIIGTSIAWHLARRGRTDVAVLEKEAAAGQGSTAKAAGGIRVQFSSPVNVELSRLSIERFENFEKEMGVSAPFTQAGYLWMAATREQMTLFEANASLQRRMGLHVELLDRAGVARKAPYVRSDDLVGGVFHGRDGYASPADFVAGYEKRARELGVRFFFGEEVIGREGRTVRTRMGTYTGEHVVIAAGAYSGKLGGLLGMEIPVTPVRRQCFVTEPMPEFPHPVPMTIDYTTGVYLHSESGGLLIGKADKEEPPGFNENADYGFLEKVAELAMARVPALENARIRTGWGGLYEVTPDNHPLIGAAGEPGWWLACGFSGHGVMHAPATGMLVAELLETGRSTMDLSALRLSRFKEGSPNLETNVI